MIDHSLPLSGKISNFLALQFFCIKSENKFTASFFNLRIITNFTPKKNVPLILKDINLMVENPDCRQKLHPIEFVKFLEGSPGSISIYHYLDGTARDFKF